MRSRITESLRLELTYETESNHLPKSTTKPKHHIYTSFKYLQRWWLNLLCWVACSNVDNPFHEDTFPWQQDNKNSCPVICDLGEEASTHFETTSF